MDYRPLIRELHAEKKRVEEVIAELEQLAKASAQCVSPEKSSRGRKRMGPEERKIVSERMCRYWAQRRADKSNIAWQ